MNYAIYDNDNNSNDKLDALAREINDKTKKYELLKTVHNEFYNESVKNKKQLMDAMDTNIVGFSKFVPSKKTDCQKSLKSSDTFINNLNNFDNVSSSSSNSTKSIIDKLKFEHNNHISEESNSILSNDYGSIMAHLKKCKKCKSKIKLVFDDNHKKKSTGEIILSLGNMKESLMTILIVVLIIFIVCMMIRFSIK